MYKSVVVIATIDRPQTHQYRTSVGDGGSGNYGRRKGDCQCPRERKQCNEMQILGKRLNGLRVWEMGEDQSKKCDPDQKKKQKTQSPG